MEKNNGPFYNSMTVHNRHVTDPRIPAINVPFHYIYGIAILLLDIWGGLHETILS